MPPRSRLLRRQDSMLQTFISLHEFHSVIYQLAFIVDSFIRPSLVPATLFIVFPTMQVLICVFHFLA
ncbi:hypothetical protein BDQ12DRAFT_682039 [Crucibulum laeve]|uniref:Uncharacterized protein n=1 Tax=Crucibulum laeve TaxID=68775 RepID=A0A5C3M322_9AGAR|nr:hypothetical protein BDQ12DRAFT_682039 [Crucibulum laeve]